MEHWEQHGTTHEKPWFYWVERENLSERWIQELIGIFHVNIGMMKFNRSVGQSKPQLVDDQFQDDPMYWGWQRGLNTAHGSHENAVIWYDTYGLMSCLEVIVYDFNLINSCAKGKSQ